MPLPKLLARTNRWLANPVIGRFAGVIPPLAIIEHTGRRSGQRYRTPIMAFPSVDGFVVALAYGKDVDWLHNVQAQGGCTLTYSGQRTTLIDPRLVGVDAVSATLPRVVRFFMRGLKVTAYLTVRHAPTASSSP